MKKRLGQTILSILIGLDQWAQTLIVAPFAIAGLADVPDPDHTISGYCGNLATRGGAWRLPAALVDGLFLTLTLGEERNHCRDVAIAEGRC